MKLTLAGYRINRNGKVIHAIEDVAFTSTDYIGGVTKQNGIYYYFNRNQGGVYIYLP